MFFNPLMIEPSYRVYQERRSELVKRVKKEYHQVENGLLVFFASFECSDVIFRQDASFFYFTGLSNGGLAFTVGMDGKSDLFVPNCVEFQKKWTGDAIEPSKDSAKKLSFENITFLGQEFRDVTISPYFKEKQYENITKKIADIVSKGGKVFVLNPQDDSQYFHQRFILGRIKKLVHDLKEENIVDVSHIVAKMRKKKDIFEVGKINDALELTALAHEAASDIIEDGVDECAVQAVAECMFTTGKAIPAYTTIVASGKNGLILHPKKNSGVMKNGELVLIDAGAKLDNYCADITRTYPVSGNFTEAQKALYVIVLATQKYIASIAKPGYFLRNDKKQDKCLRALAKKFLDKQGGYGKYFTHGIGHHLGINVHDVGDRSCPLEEGDVITIEPGIYIPEQKIGIRIEDNYWIKKEKAICLSDMIPREPNEVEKFMKSGLPSFE